jgi:hypothetical protein
MNIGVNYEEKKIIKIYEGSDCLAGPFPVSFV